MTTKAGKRGGNKKSDGDSNAKSMVSYENDFNKLTIYGSRFSYFTQKVVAGSTWFYDKGKVEFIVKTPENDAWLRERSGTHQMPVMVTGEGWVVADSTPFFRFYLDPRTQATSKLFGGAHTPFLMRLCILLMEEYFDEWIARLAVHFRWNKPESAEKTAPKMIAEMNVAEEGSETFTMMLNSIKAWGPKSCRATGISTDGQKANGDEEGRRIFAAFEKHLAKGNKFVFGDVPCAVDASLYGGLYAHFVHDVWPLENVLNKTPLVKKWTNEALTAYSATVDNAKQNKPISDISQLPDFVVAILKEFKNGFTNFVKGNHFALKNNEKSFTAKAYEENVSFLTRAYVNQSRFELTHTILKQIQSPHEEELFCQLCNDFSLHDLFVDTPLESILLKKRNKL